MDTGRVYISIQKVLAGKTAATLWSHEFSGTHRHQHELSQDDFKQVRLSGGLTASAVLESLSQHPSLWYAINEPGFER